MADEGNNVEQRRDDAWNERLVRALEARHQQAWQQQKQSQYMWRDGAQKIESVRKDIRMTKTGKIFNLDATKLKLSKKVYEECVNIIKGESPINPPGYTPLSNSEVETMLENTMSPFIQQMKKESGSYAILLAFHFSGRDTLTKDVICRMAQPYCSSEMEANYMGGRSFGAWKSNETLVRHCLLTCHKAGVSFTNRGFRSKGKNTYSITADGKRAIQQIFQKWPDSKTRLTDQLRQDDAAPAYAGLPVGSHGGAARQPTNNEVPKKKSALNTNDEEELRIFINTAVEGQQKVFKVGKDRRRFLHRLCDKIQNEIPGLVLQHESEEGTGAGRRDLYITLRRKSTNTIMTATPVRKRRRPTVTPETGRKLGGTTKKPRSACEAAANAALSRFEQDRDAMGYGPLAGSSVARRLEVNPAQLCVRSNSTIELLDDGHDDVKQETRPAEVVDLLGVDDDNNKLIAMSTIPHNPHDYRIGDECLTKDHGDRCLITQVHCNGYVTVFTSDGSEDKFSVREVKPTPEAITKYNAYKDVERKEGPVEPSKPKTRKPSAMKRATQQVAPSGVARTKISEAECIDLYTESGTAASPLTAMHTRDTGLVILIDYRERSTDLKPREMRIELTKEVQTGSLSAVCSRTRVEERNLKYGDFAYVETASGREAGRLSVVIERKRVADLVQRSANGDHWKQLARMRDTCQHAVMLIETDTQNAVRFEAYGSQSLDVIRPCHHVIENEADIFMFMGRAILSSPRIKFVQTCDSRGTFRSIGAIGVMAQSSTEVKRDAPENAPKTATEQNKLSDHLVSGGVDWRLAKEIASQFGSIGALESVFYSCTSETAKMSLMEPVLRNIGDILNCPGDRKWWSQAIFAVFSSSREIRQQKRRAYNDIKTMIGDDLCDPAVLLCQVYGQESSDAALDAAMEVDAAPLVPRKVGIVISKSLESSFERPKENSFYTLSVGDDNPMLFPACRFITTSGSLRSNELAVFLLEGSELVKEVSSAIQRKVRHDFVAVAKELATRLALRSKVANPNRGVLLVRGLKTDLGTSAKAATYKSETRLLCDMVLGSLMIDHNIVVLQAIRKNHKTTSMILRQLAMACYHFQLLPHERTR